MADPANHSTALETAHVDTRPLELSSLAPRYVSSPRLVPTQRGHAGLLPSVQSLFYVLIFALFLMTFVVQPIRIPSASMEPTLLVGDFLLMDKQLASAPGFARLLPPVGIARGDIVVFHDPMDDPAIHLVKRVIGVPGDRIHLRDGVVFRNDEALREPYTVYRSSPPDAYRDDFPSLHTMDSTVNPNWWIHLRTLVRQGEITVPSNCYFVLGDNRNDSADSRYWGFVPSAAIVGRPIVIYFSWRQPGTENFQQELAPMSTAKTLPIHTDFARWDRTFLVVR